MSTAGCMVVLSLITTHAQDFEPIPVQLSVVERVEPARPPMETGNGAGSRIVLKRLDSTRQPAPFLVKQTPDEVRRLPCRPIQGE